jgi:hypothetical protein
VAGSRIALLIAPDGHVDPGPGRLRPPALGAAEPRGIPEDPAIGRFDHAHEPTDRPKDETVSALEDTLTSGLPPQDLALLHPSCHRARSDSDLRLLPATASRHREVPTPFGTRPGRPHAPDAPAPLLHHLPDACALRAKLLPLERCPTDDEFAEVINRLTGSGVNYCVYLLLSARRWSDVGPDPLGLLGTRTEPAPDGLGDFRTERASERPGGFRTEPAPDSPGDSRIDPTPDSPGNSRIDPTPTTTVAPGRGLAGPHRFPAAVPWTEDGGTVMGGRAVTDAGPAPATVAGRPVADDATLMDLGIQEPARHGDGPPGPIAGAPGPERAAAVRTPVRSLAVTRIPRQTQFSCVDLGGGPLPVPDGLPHAAGVASAPCRGRGPGAVRAVGAAHAGGRGAGVRAGGGPVGGGAGRARAGRSGSRRGGERRGPVQTGPGLMQLAYVAGEVAVRSGKVESGPEDPSGIGDVEV